MYTPPFYEMTDRSQCLELAVEHGFGVIAAAVGGTLDATHAPFVLDRGDETAPRLRFHLARGNGLLQMIGDGARLLVVVSGPDAYVSPDWYVSEDQVPTWNYITVHLGGHGRILDAEELRAQVDALSAQNEARLAPKRPWTSAKMTPKRLDAMLRAIVGVEMTVDTIEGKHKLAQNKSLADRQGVVAGLRARDHEPSRRIADLMAALK